MIPRACEYGATGDMCTPTRHGERSEMLLRHCSVCSRPPAASLISWRRRTIGHQSLMHACHRRAARKDLILMSATHCIPTMCMTSCHNPDGASLRCQETNTKTIDPLDRLMLHRPIGSWCIRVTAAASKQKTRCCKPQPAFTQHGRTPQRPRADTLNVSY
ncbi:hypothetical protein M404DRAFT_877623 [Pisolithus tinctorius Marx 270]|uniref:Uncharacterized protein n=1 Tax=Pisolithus tinctorius Marx 270 TaxID=870435 RepID=A0A0C3JNV5_PISTI|nr:hypothetical protein M404DRAFT_877623 [Pisolithus tinctorius Marx 270]